MRFKTLILLILTVILVISQSKKPNDKRQQEVWRVECELGVVSDPDCPVDGGWTPWSVWSPCRGSCDQVGHRVRTRDCTNPPPSTDGTLCNGQREQTETCHITNCTYEDYRSLLEGDLPRSEALRQLEAVPALMDRCLHMECPFEAIKEALAVDNTWQLNAESIWNALQCVKNNMGCPVIGEWGAWGKWSACGSRCGRGLKWRLRRCDTPSPSEAQYICSGSPLISKSCEGDQCAIERRGARGSWGEWGKWSPCSESCGVGVRRRRRNCLETQTPFVSGIWGTHCRGQHDQIEQCRNKQCTLDGGWSGWGPWGPCSQTCGAGKRTRSRSCTRPIPAGSGMACTGPKTEIGSCYLTPCAVNTHYVALFNGDSYLQYRFDKQKHVLFHFYVRFMPLSPHGTLVRRGPMYTPFVRLSLQKGHICLDVAGLAKSCSLPRICSHNTVEPAAWHTAMVTVTAESAGLRLDDADVALKNIFSCEPDLPDTELDLVVGSKFYGEIQEIIANFLPLEITLEKGQGSTKSDHFPVHAKNIAYEMGSLEEGYIYLDNEYFMRIPCFSEEDEWVLDLTLKPKRESGTILFIGNINQWLHVTLQNSRLKMKMSSREYRSESMSSTECQKEQWLDVTVRKMRETNSVEAIINGRERLHVLLGPEMERKRREYQNFFEKLNTQVPNTRSFSTMKSNSMSTLCVDEYFVGGVPPEIKNKISEEFTNFYGFIATITFNTMFYDLHDLGLERYKDNILQVSSKTASMSDYYHETSWGMSNRLNLSCLHVRRARSSNDTHWLFLDTEMFQHHIRMRRARADARVLRLVSTPKEDIRGFYTCRAHTGTHTRNIVTYGVLGKTNYRLSEPDFVTFVAVFTSLVLIIGSLGWLFGEGINDIRKGYGFFRDQHMTQDQMLKAVCKYIDANKDLIGGSEAARLSKLVARRRILNAASRSSFAAEDPQGLRHQPRRLSENIPRHADIPALLETTSVKAEVSHDLFRFEPNYVSTPQHGSISSPKKKLSSSSSVGVVSPRFLCSRIIVAKSRMSPRECLASKKLITRRNRSNMLWTTTQANKAAQTILYKFQQLQNDV